MKKILVISWFYPPINSSEGIVTYKLLNNSKYEYDVFTQKNSTSWSYGSNNYLKNKQNVKTIFSEKDNLKDWVTDAVDYFKKNEKKYDIVMTRSMPPESHQIGYKIKKINPSIKWIASFGDPISNNPYDFLRKEQYCEKNGKIKKIIYNCKSLLLNCYNTKFERKIIDLCDCVIFNSDYQREFMIGDAKKNYLIIPHSFDNSLYGEKDKKNKKKTFSYFGHLDNIRSISLILKALKELYEEDNNLKNKIVFEFFGNIGEKDIEYIKENKLSPLVKYGMKVDYSESLKKMQNSDYLLFVDANLGNLIEKNIFYGAKLADYIGSKTPILGLTMIDGISADILRKTNNCIMSYSVSDIKNTLYKIVYEELYINNIIDNDLESKKVIKIFDNYVEGCRKDEFVKQKMDKCK